MAKIKLYIPTKSSFIIPEPISKPQNNPIQKKPTEKPLIPDTTIGSPSPNFKLRSYELERGRAIEDFFKNEQRIAEYEKARKGQIKPSTPNDFVPQYQKERSKAMEEFFESPERTLHYEYGRQIADLPEVRERREILKEMANALRFYYKKEYGKDPSPDDIKKGIKRMLETPEYAAQVFYEYEADKRFKEANAVGKAGILLQSGAEKVKNLVVSFIGSIGYDPWVGRRTAIKTISDIMGIIALILTAGASLQTLGFQLQLSAPSVTSNLYKTGSVLIRIGELPYKPLHAVSNSIQSTINTTKSTIKTTRDAIKTFRKYYGVDFDPSDQKNIEEIYKTLVKNTHPDLHPEDPDAWVKMANINEAYNVLKKTNVLKKGIILFSKNLGTLKHNPNLAIQLYNADIPVKKGQLTFKEATNIMTDAVNTLIKSGDTQAIQVFGHKPISPTQLLEKAIELGENILPLKGSIIENLSPSYEKAINARTTDIDEYSLLASASETIGKKYAINPKEIYNWAVKNKVSPDALTDIGISLKDENNLNNFIDAVSNNKPFNPQSQKNQEQHNETKTLNQPVSQPTIKVPQDKEVLDLLKDIDVTRNFGNSIPTWDAIPEMMKKFSISEEEARQILLDLDDKEIIHLQRYDNPDALPLEKRKYLIPWKDGSFGFITIRTSKQGEPLQRVAVNIPEQTTPTTSTSASTSSPSRKKGQKVIQEVTKKATQKPSQEPSQAISQETSQEALQQTTPQVIEKQKELLEKLQQKTNYLREIVSRMSYDLQSLYTGEDEDAYWIRQKYKLGNNNDVAAEKLSKMIEEKEIELQKTLEQINSLKSKIGSTEKKNTIKKGTIKKGISNKSTIEATKGTEENSVAGSFDDVLNNSYQEKNKELGERKGSITIEMGKPDLTELKEFYKDTLEGIKSILTNISDTYKHLQFYPDLPMHTRNDIRLLLGRIEEIYTDKANKIYASIYGGLNRHQAKLVGQLIEELNELGRIKVGRGNPTRTLEQQQKIVDDLMKQADEKVIKAVQTFRELRDALTKEQIRRGRAPDEFFENYSRIYVKEYHKNLRKGVPNTLKNPAKKYLDEAYGTAKEVRTDPEAIVYQFIEVMVDNEIEDFINKIANEYNILPKLTTQQKQAILGTENGKIRDVLPNRVYEIEGKKYYGYTPDRFVGKNSKTYLVPKEVYEMLTHFTDKGNKAIYLLNSVIRFWKSAAIASSYTKFNISNLIGDIYFALLQAPEPEALLKEFETALRWLAGQRDTEYLKSLTKFIEDNNIIGASYIEVETYKGNNPVASVVKFIAETSKMREAFLRVAYASYLYRRYSEGLASQTIAKHDWIYLEDLKKDPYHALGKIARDIEFDYAWASKTYDRLIRNGLFPFGTWYFKASWQFWRFFKKHAFKTLGFTLSIPIAFELYNYKFQKDLEMQLPDDVRDRTHLVLGKNPDGTIRIFMPQLPPDILIGSKLFSIAVGEASQYLNGEKDLKQASIDMLKRWGIREARSIEFLLNPIMRFIVGLANDKDPYDGADIYPVNKENLTLTQLNWYRGLYFVKVMIPYLSEFAGEAMLGKPVDLVEKKIIDGLIGKGVLGVYDIDPKQAIRVGDKLVSWDDYRKMKQVAGQEIYILSQVKDKWIDSGLTVQEFIMTEDFAKYMERLKKLWIDEVKSSKLWDENKKQDLLERMNKLTPMDIALILEESNRLTNLFNSYYAAWLNVKRQRLVNNGVTGEELEKTMKELEKMRIKKLYDTIKTLSRTSRAFGGMP